MSARTHAEDMYESQKLRVPGRIGPLVCGDATELPRADPAMRYPAWSSDLPWREDRGLTCDAPARHAMIEVGQALRENTFK